MLYILILLTRLPYLCRLHIAFSKIPSVQFYFIVVNFWQVQVKGPISCSLNPETKYECFLLSFFHNRLSDMFQFLGQIGGPSLAASTGALPTLSCCSTLETLRLSLPAIWQLHYWDFFAGNRFHRRRCHVIWFLLFNLPRQKCLHLQISAFAISEYLGKWKIWQQYICFSQTPV